MQTYIARNIRNGKFYIGSTNNFDRRKKEHLESNAQYPFHCALRKYPDDFEWEIFEDDSDGRELEQALLDMFFGTDMCYNLSPSSVVPHPNNNVGYQWINDGAKEICLRPGEIMQPGWNIGRLPMNNASREKLREAHLGKKRPQCASAVGRKWVTNFERTKEIYLKPGEEVPSGWVCGRMKRPPRSEESRKKTSDALKGKSKSAQHREKLSESLLKFNNSKTSGKN